MSSGEQCAVQDNVTFLQESIKRTCSTTDAIATANNKLGSLLIRLRGNTPSKLSEGEKQREPAGQLEQLGFQFDIQVGLCNGLHNQIDELAKYF